MDQNSTKLTENSFLSETLMQQLVENSTDCIKVLDQQGKILYINPGGQIAMELDDCSLSQLLPWAELWVGEEYEKAQAALATANAGSIARFQGLGLTARGTPKWWDVTVMPYYTSDGSILHLIATSRDITVYKEAEEAKNRLVAREREAYQRLANLFLQLPAIICHLRGPQHTFEFANQLYLQVVGRQEQDLLGKPIREALPEFEGVGFFEILDHVYATGEIKRGSELQAVLGSHDEGSVKEKFFNYIYQPSFDADGVIDGILVHAMDVSEQVYARHALDRLFEASIDMMCLANFEGYFLKVNPAFERILGYTEQEMLAHPVTFWIHPDDLANTIEEIKKQSVGSPSWYFENRYRAKDGSYKWLAWASLPVVAEQTIYAVAREITLQKTQEQQKDTFISIASHELKTPVTAIKGNLQLMQRRIQRLLAEEEEASSAVATIHEISALLTRALRQVEVQTRLVNDLVDASRIQVDKLKVSSAPCDLIHVIKDVIEDQRAITPTHTIIVDIPEQLEIILPLDKDRIAQVIGNYLTNALKYSAIASPVTVGICVNEPQTVRVWVKDKGPGLSKEAQEHIWERFYQVPGIEENRGAGGVGLGLGLHICQMLIAQHGGSVGVESVPGQGSTFWFTLPLVPTI